ncbi:MAG: maleylacetate reductase [Rhodobacteraceae bacterium]|nr:maleylacetate reductase [Paracoccaceae bacterium]MCY4249445.1 maleylacetate reductase [Paracoccaceae bacterium]MCY4307887.1 maleylacetate reductase [Paracoccaceae bacterium]
MGINKHLATNQSVHFRAGIRNELDIFIKEIGCSRALVLSTPGHADAARDLAEKLGSITVGAFTGAKMHTPVEVTAKALEHAKHVNADCLVSVGGGSTTGLSKAIALHTDLPQIIIPTTYAGSEATPILGQTEDGIKTTIKDDRVLPEIILYDPELVVTLPSHLSVSSGLNAMAHSVEGLYAKDRSDDSTQIAMDGLQYFVSSLPDVLVNPENIKAREDTLRGAWACGTVLGNVGMALHHKLCHTLGGSFDLPHAETHAIILPHAIAYNALAVPDLLEPLGAMLNNRDTGKAVWEFAKSLGAPLSLGELGMKEGDINLAVDIAVTNPYWNPREITRDGIHQLLRNAWAGSVPE